MALLRTRPSYFDRPAEFAPLVDPALAAAMPPRVRRLLHGSVAVTEEEGAESHYAEYVRETRRGNAASDNTRLAPARPLAGKL